MPSVEVPSGKPRTVAPTASAAATCATPRAPARLSCLLMKIVPPEAASAPNNGQRRMSCRAANTHREEPADRDHVCVPVVVRDHERARRRQLADTTDPDTQTALPQTRPARVVRRGARPALREARQNREDRPRHNQPGAHRKHAEACDRPRATAGGHALLYHRSRLGPETGARDESLRVLRSSLGRVGDRPEAGRGVVGQASS